MPGEGIRPGEGPWREVPRRGVSLCWAERTGGVQQERRLGIRLYPEEPWESALWRMVSRGE